MSLYHSCAFLLLIVYIYNTEFTMYSLGIFHNQYQVHIQFLIYQFPNKINILLTKLTYSCILFSKSNNYLPKYYSPQHSNTIKKILFINDMDASSMPINPDDIITNSYHPFPVLHTIHKNKMFYHFKLPTSQFQIYLLKYYCVSHLIKQQFISQL